LNAGVIYNYLICFDNRSGETLIKMEKQNENLA